MGALHPAGGTTKAVGVECGLRGDCREAVLLARENLKGEGLLHCEFGEDLQKVHRW